MTIPDIRSLVPHSGPMLLLDRVLSVEGENLCAEVTIRADSLFCGAQGVGAWVGIEYMAQAIAAHAGFERHAHDGSAKIGFLLGARRYSANCSTFPVGSVLRVFVHRVLSSPNGLGSFDCRIEGRSNDRSDLLATATVNVFQPVDVDRFLEGDTNESM